MTLATRPLRPSRPDPRGCGQAAADLVRDARERERAGCIPEAIACYEAAIAAAERACEGDVLSEALRQLAVVRHHRNEAVAARDLCTRSYTVARDADNDLLAAEALNTHGCLDLSAGALPEARQHFVRAVELGRQSRELGARVEQNLGVLANIQGDFEEAVVRYHRSLDAYRAASDEHGCAIVYHNLGMTSADRGEFEQADRYFRECFEIAERTGDANLQGLCLVNHAEVHLARGRFEDAQRTAEAGLALFDRLDAWSEKAEAHRMLGMVYRETGRTALAESRLRSAIDLSVSAASPLSEAEASRELAILYQGMGRNQEALSLLNAAHRLFSRLEARVDLVYVDGKMAELEAAYLAVVREWGQSIESSDTYTFGHSERVAQHAVAVARTLGLDEQVQTTIRLGAYLHDVGKVKVPLEILNKPGPLTREEFAVVQQHPIWGVELLAAVEFPWDLKPIIRWHHERYDGTGYPDRLKGDEIPLSAQIVGIVDVYDAMTTTRSYRPAFSHQAVLARMEEGRGSWSEALYSAFLASLGQPHVRDTEPAPSRDSRLALV